MQDYPATALVILAGGQATRMNGANKLLQSFDHEIQLLKINNAFQGKIQETWINSHRDYDRYLELIPHIHYFKDDTDGFLGPLMGMKSAWSHVQSDYVLFVPCDITEIPANILSDLHSALKQNVSSSVAYVSFNGQALYPFCLLKRSSAATLTKHLDQQQFSIRRCFAELMPQVVNIQNQELNYHSLNSLEELQQYRK